MKKNLLCTLLIVVSLFAFSSQKAKKVAIVKLVRGNAELLAPNGDKGKIKKDQWLTEGTIITTSNKSFVRLKFIDKSSMNIGPKSSLKIEKFSKDEAGVINVLTGKIRSQVTKSYLDMDKSKSKLFIKSRNAVMGVRGTDFMFSANQVTGAATAVLFEGAIVFNKIKKGDNLRDLEGIVQRGRFINPGEVSVAMRNKTRPTVPAKLNQRQFSKLERNQNFEVSNMKNSKKFRSKVPPGLSGDIVSSDTGNLKNQIKKLTNISVNTKSQNETRDAGQVKADLEDSKGFIRGDDVKPADGVMVHLETGTIIPPGIDSQFDPNAGEWVSTTMGGSTGNGEYVPPEGFKLTDEGQLLKMNVETGVANEVVILDIKPVDQMPSLDNAPTVEYITPSTDIEIGPSPAGMMDNPEKMQDEFNKLENSDNPDSVKVMDDGTIVNPDGTMVSPDGTVVLKDGTKISADGRVIKPDGQVITGEGIVAGSERDLARPPRPSDCSTCQQPDNFNGASVSGPPPPGKTRVKININ